MSARILLVDDDPAVEATVRFILHEADLASRLVSVSSGRQCLDVLRDGFRGVILMDVMMPEMDGWRTIEAIVENDLFAGNVVCMLTAVGDPGPRMAPLAEYVVDYLRKPVEPDDLVDAIANAWAMCPAGRTEALSY